MTSFESVDTLKREDDAATKEPIVEHIHQTPQAEGVTARLLVAIVVVILGSSIPAGFGIGALNNPHQVLYNWVESTVQSEYGHSLTHYQSMALWSVIISVFVAGAIVGASVGAWLADRLGRRNALLINHFLGIISAGFFLACKPAGSVELMILGRFLSGVTAGLATSIVPLYLSEIAPTILAGVMGVLMPVGITFGLLMSQILGMQNFLGTETLWPILLALYGVLTTVAVLLHFLLPESPTYLYLILRDDVKGRKELYKLRGASHDDQIAKEEQMLKAEAKIALDKNSEDVWNLVRILRTPELRLPLAVAVILPLGQQFSGINAVFFYSTLTFYHAGLDLYQSQMASIGTGVINFGLSLISVYLIKVCRRRVLFLTSIALSMLSQVVLVISLVLMPHFDGAGIMSMMAMMAYVLAYGFGLGPVPYMVGTEVFPPGPRSVGLAMSGMANWVGNLLVGFTFPLIHSHFGEFSFCFFIGCSILLWLFSYRLLPETLKKNAERYLPANTDPPSV
ncbi:solute carrier family 2, facilitated glucose transporter member 1-like [Oratosquilla oratoria]|uniref:solute carrier family 2, facilitated glucose transporter member 1-like n=1 Tax=Oratosquilla oratoria TaxID=337810 RepID=UPI003F76216E